MVTIKYKQNSNKNEFQLLMPFTNYLIYNICVCVCVSARFSFLYKIRVILG